MLNRSRSLGVSLFLLTLALSATASAQLRNYDLRFVPPDDARVVGFHVYVSANAMSYADWRDDVNFVPPVDGAGVATYRLTGLEALDDVYITMKSYDAAGVESVFSNEIVLRGAAAVHGLELQRRQRLYARHLHGAPAACSIPRRCAARPATTATRAPTTTCARRAGRARARTASATSMRTARRRRTRARARASAPTTRASPARRAPTGRPAATARRARATTSANPAPAAATPAAPTRTAATARPATAASAA